MSIWLTYGLLGIASGPFVVALAASVAHRESPSWSLASSSMRAPMLAASALLSSMLIEAAQRRLESAGAVAWLAIVGLLLTVIDWSCHRLPHPTVGALLGGGVMQFGLVALVQRDAGPLLRAGAASAVVLAIASTIYFVSRSGLGLGDVTLASALAFFLGWFSWQHVVAGLVLALILGAVVFGTLRIARCYRSGQVIALGPALVFAAICTILLT